jgi:hypothetical protein
MPLIDDPSCPGTSFNHRWTEEKYLNFKAKIELYAGWAREAYDADEPEAVGLWQKLFGAEFTAPEVEESKSVLLAAAVRSKSLRPIRDVAPREEFIENRGYAFSPRYSARIDGRIREFGGFRARSIRSGRGVPRGSHLEFKLVTDAPSPFSILWKVRNRGEEATRAEDLRGQLRLGEAGSLSCRESAKYRGTHYVEVYVVKDGVVVASDHHEVRIN